MAGCDDRAELERRLAACEPTARGIRMVWTSDRRAPCGEEWLLEHAPKRARAPKSPLGRARTAMRALLRGEPLERRQSLDLGRLEGIPSDVGRVHRTLLVEHDLPADFADPWLEAWHGTQQDDPEAAARLVAWSVWDPDEDRRTRLLLDVSSRFEREIRCDDAVCLRELADSLAGEAGPVGRRDALSDPIWLRTAGPELAGFAGDWVGAWKTWIAGEPILRHAVVRMGVGDEPAAALWVGGTFTGRTLLDAELGFTDAASIEPLLPRPVPSDTAGGRAAALIPW